MLLSLSNKDLVVLKILAPPLSDQSEQAQIERGERHPGAPDHHDEFHPFIPAPWHFTQGPVARRNSRGILEFDQRDFDEPANEAEAVRVEDIVEILRRPLWLREVPTLAMGPQILREPFNAFENTREIIFTEGIRYGRSLGPPRYYQPQDIQELCGHCALPIDNGEKLFVLYPCGHRGKFAEFYKLEVTSKISLEAVSVIRGRVNSEYGISFLIWTHTLFAVHRQCQRIWKLRNRDRLFLRCQWGYCRVLSIDDQDVDFNSAILLMKEMCGWRRLTVWQRANDFSDENQLLFENAFKNLISEFRWKWNPNYPPGPEGDTHWRPHLVGMESDVINPDKWDENLPNDLSGLVDAMSRLPFLNGTERPYNIEDPSRRLKTNQREVGFAQFFQEYILPVDHEYVDRRIGLAMRTRSSVDLIAQYGLKVDFTNTRLILTRLRTDPNDWAVAIPDDWTDADPDEFDDGQAWGREPPMNTFALPDLDADVFDMVPDQEADQDSSSAGDAEYGPEPCPADKFYVRAHGGLATEDRDLWSMGQYIAEEMKNDLQMAEDGEYEMPIAIANKYKKWLEYSEAFRRQVLGKPNATVILPPEVDNLEAAELVLLPNGTMRCTLNGSSTYVKLPGLGISSLLSLAQEISQDSDFGNYSKYFDNNFENCTQWSRNISANYSMIRKIEFSEQSLVHLDEWTPDKISRGRELVPKPKVPKVSYSVETAQETACPFVNFSKIIIFRPSLLSLRTRKMWVKTSLSMASGTLLRIPLRKDYTMLPPYCVVMMSPSPMMTRPRNKIPNLLRSGFFVLDARYLFCCMYVRVFSKLLKSSICYRDSFCPSTQLALFQSQLTKISEISKMRNFVKSQKNPLSKLFAVCYKVSSCESSFNPMCGAILTLLCFFQRLDKKLVLLCDTKEVIVLHLYKTLQNKNTYHVSHIVDIFEIGSITAADTVLAVLCLGLNSCLFTFEMKLATGMVLTNYTLKSILLVLVGLVFVYPNMSEPRQRYFQNEFSSTYFKSEVNFEVESRKDLYYQAASFDLERQLFSKMVSFLRGQIIILRESQGGDCYYSVQCFAFISNPINMLTSILDPIFENNAIIFLRHMEAMVETICGVLDSLEFNRSHTTLLLTWFYPDGLLTWTINNLFTKDQKEQFKLRGKTFAYRAKQTIMKLRSTLAFLFEHGLGGGLGPGFEPNRFYYRLFMSEEHFQIWTNESESRFPLKDLFNHSYYTILSDQLFVYQMMPEDLEHLNDIYGIKATVPEVAVEAVPMGEENQMVVEINSAEAEAEAST